MKFVFNRKDIIAMNQEFDNGNVINEASLDFALAYCNKTENWTRALAYLTRAILVDHIFEEGNKRTAALIIVTYAAIEGHDIYPDRIVKLITNIILKNTISITRIEELIKDAIK